LTDVICMSTAADAVRLEVSATSLARRTADLLRVLREEGEPIFVLDHSACIQRRGHPTDHCGCREVAVLVTPEYFDERY
jgi:hypothetical protein